MWDVIGGHKEYIRRARRGVREKSPRPRSSDDHDEPLHQQARLSGSDEGEGNEKVSTQTQATVERRNQLAIFIFHRWSSRTLLKTFEDILGLDAKA